METGSTVSLLGNSLLETFKRLPSLIVIAFFAFLIGFGPVALMAIGLGALMRYSDLLSNPESFSTQTADGETKLTMLGEFIMWHNDNDWLIPVIALFCIAMAFSWLSVAWLRKLSGERWVVIPALVWLGGAVLIFLLELGVEKTLSSYLGYGLTSQVFLSMVVIFVFLRLAPIWHRLALRRSPDLIGSFKAMTSQQSHVLIAAVFFTLVPFAIGYIVDQIDSQNFGTTWAERVLGLIGGPIMTFWLLTTAFILGQRAEGSTLSDDGPVEAAQSVPITRY